MIDLYHLDCTERDSTLAPNLASPCTARLDCGQDVYDQKDRIKWLGQQVCRAGLERLGTPAVLTVPTEDQDRHGDGPRGGHFSKLADHVEAVRAGHREVGEHDVRVERVVHTVHCLRHGVDTVNRGPRHLEKLADELPGVGV